jgi:hypothetical protein
VGACVTATPRRTRSERRLHVETARVTVASARFVNPRHLPWPTTTLRVHSRSTHRPPFLAAGTRDLVQSSEFTVQSSQFKA